MAGSYVTTPQTAEVIELLGSSLSYGGIAFSRDEVRALARLYGFKPEEPHQRPPKPEPVLSEKPLLPWERQDAERAHKAALERWEKWVDPSPMHQAGADRNMIRHAEHDGLRLIAWLAKYIPQGADPLRALIQLAMNAGFDVCPSDVSWAVEDEEEL